MAHTDTVGEVHTINIDRRRGATKLFRVRLLVKDTTTPVDVTGYTAELNIHSIREPVDLSTLIFQAPGIPTATPADGILEFDFSLFDPVPIGRYFYGMRVIDAATLDDVPMIGTFNVDQDRSTEVPPP